MSDSFSGQNELKPWTAVFNNSAHEGFRHEIWCGDRMIIAVANREQSTSICDAHNVTLERKLPADIVDRAELLALRAQLQDYQDERDLGIQEASEELTHVLQKKISHDFVPWKPPFHYVEMLTCVHDSENNIVLDIRGWGRLTGTGGGLALGEERARGIQDRLGELVAKLLTLTSVGALIEEQGPLPVNENTPVVPSSNVTGEQKGESDE